MLVYIQGGGLNKISQKLLYFLKDQNLRKNLYDPKILHM